MNMINFMNDPIALMLGMSSDSLTIVVSEETGAVSTAYKGHIEHDIDSKYLKEQLKQLQNRHREATRFELIKRRFKNGKQDSKDLHK